jgi:nucleoside-diphosphate-sugar epimerase
VSKILLIGGGGFIGHHIVDQLFDRHEFYVLDSFFVNSVIEHLGNERYLSFINERYAIINNKANKIYKFDARDYHAVSIAVEDCKPDIIIHLAAVAHANKSNKNPYNTFDHSLRTLENSLDAARSVNVKQFIYFSSSMVYGDFTNGLAKEDDCLNPKGIYGALKLCGELMVKSYNEVFNTPYTIVRPSALYGPRCVSRRVIQVFIENLLDSKELSVDGDGSDRLDFTYIDDFIQGLSYILDNEKALGKAFNITYGKAASIADVIDVLRCLFDSDCCVNNKQRDKLMPVRGSLDINRIKGLGYNPEYPISVGIEQYLNWYRKR